MIKKFNIILSLAFFLSLSCNSYKKPNTSLLNGYWKIDFVSKNKEIFKLKGGTLLLDYYYLNENMGWRKKVRPLLDEKFETSNDTTFFKIKMIEQKSSLFFETKWHNWEEMILKLDSVSLILKIKDKNYHYKKFNPDL